MGNDNHRVVQLRLTGAEKRRVQAAATARVKPTKLGWLPRA